MKYKKIIVGLLCITIALSLISCRKAENLTQEQLSGQKNQEEYQFSGTALSISLDKGSTDSAKLKSQITPDLSNYILQSPLPYWDAPLKEDVPLSIDELSVDVLDIETTNETGDEQHKAIVDITNNSKYILYNFTPSVASKQILPKEGHLSTSVTFNYVIDNSVFTTTSDSESVKYLLPGQRYRTKLYRNASQEAKDHYESSVQQPYHSPDINDSYFISHASFYLNIYTNKEVSGWESSKMMKEVNSGMTSRFILYPYGYFGYEENQSVDEKDQFNSYLEHYGSQDMNGNKVLVATQLNLFDSTTICEMKYAPVCVIWKE
ncbi:MAG: hypothetical protein ACOX2M_03675 [Fastidiosipilaceae bacterium]|jgi:hypothetical protein